MIEVSSSQAWKVAVFAGLAAVVFGFAGLGFDSSNYEGLFLAIGLGLLCFCLGVTGWTHRWEKRRRRKVGAAILLVPIVVVVLAGFVDANVHGIFPLFFMASIPICIFGIAILLASLKG